MPHPSPLKPFPGFLQDRSRGEVLAILVCLPVVLLLLGSAGYMLVEGWGAFDSLYMSAITLTTVGYLEVHPLTTAGRMFTMGYLLVGVFTMFYAATELVRAVVSGELRGDLGRRRMERMLEEMRDHVIVCGYGRMGHLVCAEFSARDQPFVVVERRGELLEGFALPHGVALPGDATTDEVLKRAGVGRARCLVTVAASDADNLFITMSARLLNDRLYIVARADGEEAERKLLRAGATRVVSPYVIGGQRVAQAVLRPTVLDFLELATRRDYLEIEMEEVEVAAGSPLVGAPLKDGRIRRDLGIILVAIKNREGKMMFNPPSDMVLNPGDVLVALGHTEQLERLAQLAGA
jgi:voltage-gated potassium channel